ncbi:ATP-binding protein [Candidatus Omnitrophota bacterium]
MKIYQDTLHLWNVGELSKTITFAQLKRKHPSYKRNELLADVFFKAGLIESWGRGTLKIINECKAKNIPAPKFVGEFGGFSVTFKKAAIIKEIDEGLNEGLNEGLCEGLNEGLKSLYKAIAKKPDIQAKDLIVILDNRPLKTIERQVKKLVELNLVERKGSRKTGGYWVLKR